MSAQSLFIAGGLLLVLAALAGGGLKVKEVDIPKLAPWARAAAGAAGVSAVALGVFPGIYSEPTSPAPPSASTSGPAPGSIATGEAAAGSTSAVTVKILRPLSGGTIKLHDKVRIEASGVRPDQQVWILVAFEGDSKWFPQGPCQKISGGLYECSTQVGDVSTSKGTRFSLSAEVVTASSAVAYQPLYESGFEAANPPVTPVGVSATITIIRV